MTLNALPFPSRSVAALAMLLASASAQLQAAPAATTVPSPKTAILILGTPHLANNNRDVANVKVEDVLVPARQQEIESVVAALARFKPTRIAIEWPAREQADLDARYADYRAGRLELTASERDQIALRLAARLGLPAVDAINWNELPPGDFSSYDYAAWAQANGQGPILQALVDAARATADAQTIAMHCSNVAQWYRALNTPENRVETQRFYLQIARIGNAEALPGAAWVGTWYARNLRIYGNLVDKLKPSDRVLVLYGFGHSYLLNQLARDSGRFEIIDPLAFLPKGAVRKNCG